MIKEVLEAIKSECKANDDECISCPFNISDNWHDYCLFMGITPYEGITPDMWELDKIKYEKGGVWPMIKDRETRLEYYRDYQKLRREACRKEGICIICQKEKATPGRSTCESCRKYHREYNRASRVSV